MLRSLVIGFLILSAVTSRNAGIQINQITDLSPDILLQFLNAAFTSCDEQQPELSEEKDALLAAAHKKDNAHVKSVKTRYDSVPIFFDTAACLFDAVFCLVAALSLKQKCSFKFYFCITDISPPYYFECAKC